jgi:mono/diheme cytochrome c family protein
MPRAIFYILLLLVALSLIPVAAVYKSRHGGDRRPRIQVVYDMDQQVKFKNQAENPFFADGRAMRSHPEGTVARGALMADEAFHFGTAGTDSTFVETFPVTVTQEMVMRGRERYAIHCAPCHGLAGDGQGLVHLRAAGLAEGTWTPPTDLGGETVVDRPAGHIYNTINNGIRNMPAYGPQITPEDRWAIVAWVRALQLTRNATIDDVPAEIRATLQ